MGRSDASERHRLKGSPNQTNKKSSGLPRHDHQERRWTRVQYRAFTIATHRIEEQCDAKGHAYGRSHDDHELPSISELYQQLIPLKTPPRGSIGRGRSCSDHVYIPLLVQDDKDEELLSSPQVRSINRHSDVSDMINEFEATCISPLAPATYIHTIACIRPRFPQVHDVRQTKEARFYWKF